MKAVLVDSNVIIDIFKPFDIWQEWSAPKLSDLASSGARLVINPVILAEVAMKFNSARDLDLALPQREFYRQAIPWEACHLAGKAFMRYRQSGGSKTGVLPDFFIGAHAQVAKLPLITRDKARYTTYFPSLELIAP